MRLEKGKINNEVGVGGVRGTSATTRRAASCHGTMIKDGKVNQTVSSGTNSATSSYTTRSKSKPPSVIAKHESTPKLSINCNRTPVSVVPEKKSYLGLYHKRQEFSAKTNKSSASPRSEIVNTPYNSSKTTSTCTVSDITEVKPALAQIEESSSINYDSPIHKPNNIIEYNKTQAGVWTSSKRQSSYLDMHKKRKQLAESTSKSTYSDPKLSNSTTLPPINHNKTTAPENETKTTESCLLIPDSCDNKPLISDDTDDQLSGSDHLPSLSDITIHLPILTAHKKMLDMNRSIFDDNANKHIVYDNANPKPVVSDNAIKVIRVSNTTKVTAGALVSGVSENAVKPMVFDTAMKCEFVSDNVNNPVDPEHAEIPIVFDNATKVSIASDNNVNTTGDSTRESHNIKLESEHQPEPNTHTSIMETQNETYNTPKSTSSKPDAQSKPVSENTSVIRPRSKYRSSTHTSVSHSKSQIPKSTSYKSTAQSKPVSENTSVIKPTSESRSSTNVSVNHSKSASRSRHTGEAVSQSGPTKEIGTEIKQTSATVTKRQSSTKLGSARKSANHTNTQTSENKSKTASKLTPSKPKPAVDFVKKNIEKIASLSGAKAVKEKENKIKQEASTTKFTHKSKNIEEVKKQNSKLPKLAVKHTKKSTHQLANSVCTDNESPLPPVVLNRRPSKHGLYTSQQTVRHDIENIQLEVINTKPDPIINDIGIRNKQQTVKNGTENIKLETINTKPEPIINDIGIRNKHRPEHHVVASRTRPTSANETETKDACKTPIRRTPSNDTYLTINNIHGASMRSNPKVVDTQKGMCDHSPAQYRRIIQPPGATVVRPPGATYLEARYNAATDVNAHRPTQSADVKRPHPASKPAPHMSRSRQLKNRHVVRPCGTERTTLDTGARIQLSSSGEDTEDEESEQLLSPMARKDQTSESETKQFDNGKADHHVAVETIAKGQEAKSPQHKCLKHLRHSQMEGVHSVSYGKLSTIGQSLDMSPCPPYVIKLPPIQGVQLTLHQPAIKPIPMVWKTDGASSLDKTVLPSIGLASAIYSGIAHTKELCPRQDTSELFLETSDYTYSEESDSECPPQRPNTWTTTISTISTISAESSSTEQSSHHGSTGDEDLY